MTMTQHKLIDKWGRVKYNLPENATVRVEQKTIYGGFCETCSYEYEVTKIYSIIDGVETELDQYETDLASLLREILDFAANELGS